MNCSPVDITGNLRNAPIRSGFERLTIDVLRHLKDIASLRRRSNIGYERWNRRPHPLLSYRKGAFGKKLDELQEQLTAGNWPADRPRPHVFRTAQEAEQLAMEHFMSVPLGQMPYQPFGDLRLTFPGHDKVENYRRELDLDTAIATTTTAASTGRAGTRSS